MHTIFPGLAIGAPSRALVGTSGRRSPFFDFTKSASCASPPFAKKYAFQSLNSPEQSLRTPLGSSTPGLSLRNGPNRINFIASHSPFSSFLQLAQNMLELGQRLIDVIR